MKRYLIKLLVIIALFTCVFTVNAIEGVSLSIGFDEGSEGKGKVQYSANNGEWIDVSASQDSIVLPDELTAFKIKVVPNEYYETAFETGPLLETGPLGSTISFHAGDQEEARALLIGDGYSVTITDGLQTISLTNIKFNESTSKKTSSVSVDITGPGLEYWNGDYPSRINFFINTPQGEHEEQFIPLGGAENLTWKGDYEIDGVFVKKADGVSTINPVSTTYDYDGNGNVTIPVSISNASTKITSFIVNEVDYKDQCPQSDEEFLEALNDARSIGFEIKNVPYSDNYVIQIVAEFNDLMGSFGWNYLPEESQTGDTRDDCIAHGTLEFIQGEYEGMVFDSVDAWNDYKYNGISHIFEWHDGDKNYTDERDAWGSAAFPRGAKITMKLIPDPGYQLVYLYGDENVVAEDEVGVYTITMTGGMNSHLMAKFEETDNEAKSTHGDVSTGSIDIMENNIEDLVDNGTIRLNINEASDPAVDEFEAKAQEEEVEIQTYLDINLDNIIHKASDTSDGAWILDKDLSTLTQPAEVTIELKEEIDGEVVVLHETHDGDIEVLEARKDGNTIYFETTSFSDYALANRSSSLSIDVVAENGAPSSDNPESASADETGIMLIVEPDDGYVYDHLEPTGIEEDDTDGYSVLLSGWPTVGIMINKMPNNDVSFMVYFVEGVEITFDANGGEPGEMWQDSVLIKKGQHEESPFRIFDDLIRAPEGKEYDGVIIDGVAYGPDDPYDFNDSVTIVYQWKDVTNQDECIIHFDLDGAKPGPYYEEEATLAKGEKITIPNIEEIKGLVVIPECKEYSGFILNGKIYEPGSEFEVPNEDEITIKIYWKDNHNWLEWTIITEATETKTGLRKRICKNNPEHYQIEIIPIKAKREVPDTKVV